MECFSLQSDIIAGRMDPYYYKPNFQLLEKKLHKSNFRIINFSEIIRSITNGYDYREYSEDGLIYLRVGNVKPFELDLFDVKKIRLDRNNISKNISLRKGIILLTRKGTFGVAVSIKEDSDYIISSEIFRIELKDNSINPDFLEIILNSVICQKQFDKVKIGAIMGSLSQDVIGTLSIPYPPIKIQNKIIYIFQNANMQCKLKKQEADKLLTSIESYLLNELDIKLQVFKDNKCFVVDSDETRNNRFDPYYYQPKFEEIEKAISKGKYKSEILGNLSLQILSGQRPKGGVRQISNGIPSLGGEHVFADGTISQEDLKYIPIDFHKKHIKSKAAKLDIILVKDGATTGKVGIIPETYPFDEININEHVFLVRCKKEINPYYLFSFLKSQLGQIQLNREITGGTIMGLIRDSAINIKVPVPQYEIQNKIAKQIKNIMIDSAKLQNEVQSIIATAKAEVEKIILENK